MLTRLRFLAASLVAASALLLAGPVRADAPGTIVDVAVGAGSFTTLVAAVKAAGLADTLSGPGKFTVFAPTDAAFAKLPAGTRRCSSPRTRKNCRPFCCITSSRVRCSQPISRTAKASRRSTTSR